MLDSSNGPIIPERTLAKTSLSPSKEDRRRRSLPAASHRKDRRRDSNRVTIKPASTEVISSLIETLSTISSPAEQHFDSQPNISASHSTPVSPRPWQTDYPMIAEPSGSNMHQGAALPPSVLRSSIDKSTPKRPHGVDASYFLHPDHASGKGSSPRRSPTKESFRVGVREPEDPNDFGVIYSIGNVSIEPKPWQSTTSVNSTTSDVRKSVRSVRSLGFKSSRDSLREPEDKIVSNPKRGRRHKPERLIIGETPPSSPPADQLAVSKRAARTSVNAERPNVPQRSSSVQSSGMPRRQYWNAEDVSGGPSDVKRPHNIPSQDYIPTRESSKRHSIGMSSTHGRRRSRQSDHDSAQGMKRVSVEYDSTTLQRALRKVAHEAQQEPEQRFEPKPEDSVTRRIKELKDQKMQRDQSSMETPTEYVSAPETPNRGLSPSPLPVAPQTVVARNSNPKQELIAAEADATQVVEDAEKSAPSPAIAQRAKRNSMIGNRSVTTRDPPTTTSNEKKRRSFTTPQRSNSRLLKRLSRPTSPATAEKHRRTFSNPLNQPSRDTVYLNERNDGDSIDDAVEDFLSAPRLNQKIKHSLTGRVISFSEVGDTDGSVVFCCVGMGLTRFLTAFYDELASTLKLRLITPDRPGVGGSEPHADGFDTPLGWPDDVRAICENLKITKFSIMAHSAGAIYALATALRMSQHIRCRVHLLAPWIPPSQMSVIGAQQEPLPATTLPYSQRILRALPTTFLRAANSSFLSTTSASITTSLPNSPRRSKRRSSRSETQAPDLEEVVVESRRDTSTPPKVQRSGTDEDPLSENKPPRVSSPMNGNPTSQTVNEKERSSNYETRLTEAIWEAATTGANPAVDLLVCLERRQPIGFRYVDITRAVVVHHGSKDTRVPIENVKWLSKTMRRCEVRVLEGEGHGLMASAAVMGNVLMEMAQEWEDWNRVVRGKGVVDMRATNGV